MVCALAHTCSSSTLSSRFREKGTPPTSSHADTAPSARRSVTLPWTAQGNGPEVHPALRHGVHCACVGSVHSARALGGAVHECRVRTLLACAHGAHRICTFNPTSQVSLVECGHLGHFLFCGVKELFKRWSSCTNFECTVQIVIDGVSCHLLDRVLEVWSEIW